MKDKFIRKYMRIAKEIGDYENPCFSRKIGSVIVNPETNSIVGTGYNGPPKGVPHCDSRWHWEKIVLTNVGVDAIQRLCKQNYFHKYDDVHCIKSGKIKGKCPRRILDIPSGEQLELCSCEHAERNAIYNAQTSTQNCYIFCHCCIPCMDCSKAIINSGIKKIFCLSSTEDYSPQSRPLLEVVNIEIIEHNEEWYDLKGV